MIYALRIGWCALESVDTEIKHLDNWLIDTTAASCFPIMFFYIFLNLDGLVCFDFWANKGMMWHVCSNESHMKTSLSQILCWQSCTDEVKLSKGLEELCIEHKSDKCTKSFHSLFSIFKNEYIKLYVPWNNKWMKVFILSIVSILDK